MDIYILSINNILYIYYIYIDMFIHIFNGSPQCEHKKITQFTNNGTLDLSHQAWWKRNTKYLTIFKCRVVFSYIRMDKYIYIYTWLSMYIRSTYIYIYILLKTLPPLCPLWPWSRCRNPRKNWWSLQDQMCSCQGSKSIGSSGANQVFKLSWKLLVFCDSSVLEKNWKAWRLNSTAFLMPLY